MNARAPGRKGWLLFAALLLAVGFLLLQPTVFAQDGGRSSAGSQSLFIARSLFIVLLLVLLNGFFAMAEAALLSVRRTRIEQLVEEGNRTAKIAAQLLAEPTRMLSTIQVGITLVGLFSAGAAAESVVAPFAQFLREQFPGTFLASASGAISFVTVILGVGLLTLVIGEITPKSIAVLHAERITLWSAYPIRAIQTLTSPVVSVVTWISNLLVRPLGGKATFQPSALSEDELRLLVEQSEEHGVIESEEKEMIHSIFDFAQTVVRKVMTPRLDITAIEADASVEELIHLVSESGHSRLPVFEGNLDNIIGIIHVKDVLQATHTKKEPFPLRELLRKPYFVPENKRVDDLLTEFRRYKTQMAIVRDEYGTVTGVVTIEDLLEEIVGEIQDEYDMEEPLIQQIDENICIVDARMSLEDFNERMGADLPVEEADTIGGFVFGLMGHQPAQDEKAAWNGFEFQVEETDGKRIQKVRVYRSPKEDTATSMQDMHAPDGEGEIDRPSPSRMTPPPI